MEIYAVLPLKLYPVPFMEKQLIVVGRDISLNALKQERYRLCAVAQRVLAANVIHDGSDLLDVGIQVGSWVLGADEGREKRILVDLDYPVAIERFWFDTQLGCFLCEGETIRLRYEIVGDYRLVHVKCKEALNFIIDAPIQFPANVMTALRQWKELLESRPVDIVTIEKVQHEFVKFVYRFLPYLHEEILPEDYAALMKARTFEEFVDAFIQLASKVKSLIEAKDSFYRELRETEERHARLNYLRMVQESLSSQMRELGADLTGDAEIDELLKEVNAHPALPQDLKRKLREELYAAASIYSSERSVATKHVRFVLSLPWGKYVEPRTDMNEICRILEGSHYGLTDVKERILEYVGLYVHLKRPPRGNILCFIGPPGTGKTSFAAAVAEALGLPFHRISLGGVDDESVIRGHRRTYVGAMPGRIAAALEVMKAMNGVIFLDEIDKCGHSVRGRPEAALLEVLDPDRNFEFFDHYVDYPLDLSQILFICGANFEEGIHPILADRMEFIKFGGYTLPEKAEIVKHYFVPRICKEWKIENLLFTDDAVSYIVSTYGRWESGVREVKRRVEAAIRKALVFGEKVIDEKFLKKHFPPHVHPVEWDESYFGKIGFMPILTVTSGGDGRALWVEIYKVPLEEKKDVNAVEVVGQVDDALKQSVRAAYIWCVHNLPEEFRNYKWIFYFPSVSTSYGGPSASAALAVGMWLVYWGVPLKAKIAITGEITPSGYILPVGGVIQKLIAAENMGFEIAYIPQANYEETLYWLEKRQLRLELEIRPVEHIDEILNELKSYQLKDFVKVGLAGELLSNA